VAGAPLTVGPRPTVLVLLAVALIVSELWPIPVPRAEQSTDEITLSSTFGLALLFVAPLWCVIAVQALALVSDTVLRRRAWSKLAFNMAQYALSYAAAGVVYTHLLAGRPWTGSDVHLNPVAALAAGIVFFVLNNGLIAGVLALQAGRSVFAQLGQDVRWQMFTAVPATALAPVMAATSLRSPWLLLFTLSPLVAVIHSGQLASRREHEALHDALTGLGNRAMLFGVLDRVFSGGNSGRHAVLLMDLDHFKDVNDTLGHQTGDALLRAAAEVLSSLVPTGGLVTRLGGDEFAILLEDSSLEHAQQLAESLVQGFRHPCVIDGMSLRVRGSIGIALYPDDGLTRADVLRRADVALYKAKETRDRYVCYQPGYDRSALNQLSLVNDLAAELETPGSDQLRLAYQPLVSGVDGALFGVECLVRWEHPRLGPLLPAAFLPLAEHAGLTGALDRRVLELAVAQQLAWTRTGLDLRVSVNVSVPQLSDTGLPELVARILAHHGVRPSRLVLEVTENCLISDPDRSSEILRRIRATGAHVSIDDYGSGYSSLAYVKQLEVDELKIDRQFVAGVADDITDRIIVQSTIDLAHQLNLRVVAEGIEDLVTAALLRDMGCDVLQGYALGRPSTPRDIAAYVPVVLPEPVAPSLHVVRSEVG
jgi:diguanylate cyclase (GGDEF)-like protein